MNTNNIKILPSNNASNKMAQDPNVLIFKEKLFEKLKPNSPSYQTERANAMTSRPPVSQPENEYFGGPFEGTLSE